MKINAIKYQVNLKKELYLVKFRVYDEYTRRYVKASAFALRSMLAINN